MATNKSLIVLQENSGNTPFDDSLPGPLRQAAQGLVDGLAETFEDLKTSLLAGNHYDIVHYLTDNACTRAKLLERLIDETRKGRTIDLVALGHGSPEKLVLKSGPNLTGQRGANTGTIRDLLKDARAQGVKQFNLRLVYMCNCDASTVNDDWLAIGAQASVGARRLNAMPEPTKTFFLHNWLGGQKVKDAARKAYEASIPFWVVVYPPRLKVRYKTIKMRVPAPTFRDPFATREVAMQVPDGAELIPNDSVVSSQLLVAGHGNLKF